MSDSQSTAATRDKAVLDLYDQLVEIEQRLIPTGLHVFGRASQADEKADLLRMIASFDRSEAGARALPDLVAEGLGVTQTNQAGRLEASIEERIDSLVRQSISEFVANGQQQAETFLQREANVPVNLSHAVFELLQEVTEQLKTNTELDSLVRALRGEFIEPGPGADIVQNPSVLPTGRNTHAINPYSVPSVPSFARSRVVAERLLARFKEERGSFPESIALVLWGLDNIKTQGDGVAQALWLLGVRPVRDPLNRVTQVEPISLEELRRPRIDVVMTVSGIFRDLFSPTVQLLDRAVRLVARLDAPHALNYGRKHALGQWERD